MAGKSTSAILNQHGTGRGKDPSGLDDFAENQLTFKNKMKAKKTPDTKIPKPLKPFAGKAQVGKRGKMVGMKQAGVMFVLGQAGIVKQAQGAEEITMEPMDIKGEYKPPAKKQAPAKAAPKPQAKAAPAKAAPKAQPKAAPKANPFANLTAMNPFGDEAAMADMGGAREINMPAMDIKGEYRGGGGQATAQKGQGGRGSYLGDLGPFAEKATPGNPLEYTMDPMNVRGDAGGGMAQQAGQSIADWGSAFDNMDPFGGDRGGGEADDALANLLASNRPAPKSPFANLNFVDPFSDVM